jgi:integrase
VEEARTFLESACNDQDPLYAAYVLVLVLGLRRGEALGLTWQDVSLDAAELAVTWQIQRTRGQLHHREKDRRVGSHPALARHLRDRAQAPR